MRDSKPSLVARDRTWRTTTLSTAAGRRDRKSTRLNSSHDQISYAVFCLKKKKKEQTRHTTTKGCRERVVHHHRRLISHRAEHLDRDVDVGLDADVRHAQPL